MIGQIRRVCFPILTRRGTRRYFAADFLMRILITVQPALSLPVFLNLVLTAYEEGQFGAMAWYAALWLLFGALFLAGRYRFDILVIGRFFYKEVEEVRDVCLGGIYDRNQEIGSGYDANPYYAFLREGTEEFAVLVFRVDRLAAVFLVTLVFFLWCIRISPGMAALALAGGALNVAAGNFASKRLNKANETMFRRKGELNHMLRCLFFGTETYLVKARYQRLKEKYGAEMAEYSGQNCRNAREAGRRENGLRIMDCAVYVVMILWCHFFLREKSAAVILTMVSAYQTIKGYVNELNSSWMMLVENQYLLDRYESLTSPQETWERKKAVSKDGKAVSKDGKAVSKDGKAVSKGNVLEVRNLCYRAGESSILQDINLEIRQREKVALIGWNGAGKSTLLRCLLQLLQPTGGEIRYRDPFLCSYLPVNAQLFPVSIRENIMYASGGESPDMADIMEAADVARIDSIGLDQELPDGEENLSGGESKRVAIARALAGLRQIMIADEPTSSLDILTEKKVMGELFARTETLIYTTHNPALVSLADRVYIMKKGRIAGSGTPEEVCNLPVYREWEQSVLENQSS
ncbi:MAG: ABC transporter ATP-binding protein [Lachnospiraceae bacterium]|uniref:ABC transporter ATP-binding protein n=1 Tax=uncultured Acetatifactor sp. TaxID=1671927 RepID=UPI00260E7394|nr:ABC transporter ATP-binding protein [uncultured Acetatifactor sp.]MCI8787715.1 ABC transporter ATP-binding protein [Lachnospiraceae bacterium]